MKIIDRGGDFEYLALLCNRAQPRVLSDAKFKKEFDSRENEIMDSNHELRKLKRGLNILSFYQLYCADASHEILRCLDEYLKVKEDVCGY